MFNRRFLGIRLAICLTLVGQVAGYAAAETPSIKKMTITRTQVAPSIAWVDDTVPAQAVILCIHGLGLHKGTYEAFGKRMAKIGLPTYAIDIRGFGEWQEEKKRVIDFDGAMADIKQSLELIKKRYPDKPIVVLGESMGGAIALRATAMYPDLIAGLISSVPANDRFAKTKGELSVGLHVLFGGGSNKPMNIEKMVVDRATQKDDLRKTWANDPLGRMTLTPNQLIEFNKFMQKNFVVAKEINKVPVLFIQGANDKLVRPAGTWELFDSLATTHRQLVLSKNSEHLIFEDGQFGEDDLSFVEKWINKNVTPLTAVAIASDKAQPAVASATDTDPTTAIADAGSTTVTTTMASTTQTADKITATSATSTTTTIASSLPHPLGVTAADNARISYWIELYRSGKIYRCNNKTSFKSGDSIRFHIIAQSDGYAYVVMKQSSSGKSATLFPSAETGTNNFLTKGQDYACPNKSWLKFDQNPGVEKVSLVFSQRKIRPDIELQGERYLTAYVSPEETGSKDLVPTRMQLSWDDPTPVIIPEDFSGNSQLAVSRNSSLVKLSFNGPGGVLAVDIALAHQ